MSRRPYLTVAEAKRLKPGDRLLLEYDDFNRGRFIYTHLEHGEHERTGGLLCRGSFDYDDEPEVFESEIYEFGGPHRTPPRVADLMVRGSGAERLMVVRRLPRVWGT